MTQEIKDTRKYRITTLIAVLLFAAATFQIADSHILLGVIFFGAAACFSCLAAKYRREHMPREA